MIGRGRRQGAFEATHIDMVPMVDCIMVLLIFLMISSAFVEDPGIEVQKPDVSGSLVNETNALLIAVSQDNRIFFDGQEVRPDQVAAVLRQASFGRASTLIIRADRNASHGTFATVYGEAKKAGLQHIQFATSKAD